MAQTNLLKRAAAIVGITLLVGLLALVFLKVISVVLLVFGSIIIAVFFRGLAELIETYVPVPSSVALALALLGPLLGLTGILWLTGPDVVTQMSELSEQLPQAQQEAKDRFLDYTWGQALLDEVDSVQTLVSGDGGWLAQVTRMVSSTLSAVTQLLLALLLGIYLAVHPAPYVQGFLHLIPINHRERTGEVLSALQTGLQWWLVGRISSMFVIGILTTIGLWIIGMPLAVSLGLIAALLSFVPYIGPIVSVIPAALLAVGESPEMLLSVGIVYLVVQVLEGNLITPLIQQRAVSIPPAILIVAQLLMGIMFGLTGVLLATPLAVALIILVQMLYVEDTLGDSVEVLGSCHAS